MGLWLKHAGPMMALAAATMSMTAQADPAANAQLSGADPAALVLDEIVARERAFSDLAGKTSTRAAFLAFIADDGIIFAPGPVRGKGFLAGAPDGPGTLSWVPSYAGVAASADLAFTSGPYLWKNGTATQTGQYLTVWRRQANGEWRFVLDRGTPGPVGATTAIEKVKLASSAIALSNPHQAKVQPNLLAEEAALSAASLQSAGTGLLARLASNGRLLREGYAPALDAAEHAELLRAGPAKLRYRVLGSSVSARGDLGYTYGEAASEGAAKAWTGNFVRIWQRRDGRWYVVLDSLVELPPALSGA